jgi:DNA-binding NarL/FixJ family response regulator
MVQAAGASGFVNKPVDPEQLLSAIQRAFEGQP